MGRPDPIWGVLREQGRYNLVWLARRTGFSHSHVKAMASGRSPCSRRFRAACAALLGLPEADLFDHTDSSGSPSDSSDQGDDRAGTAALCRAYHTEEVPSLGRSA